MRLLLSLALVLSACHDAPPLPPAPSPRPATVALPPPRVASAPTAPTAPIEDAPDDAPDEIDEVDEPDEVVIVHQHDEPDEVVIVHQHDDVDIEGIVDVVDKCPTELDDHTGMDDDGCPDPVPAGMTEG